MGRVFGQTVAAALVACRKPGFIKAIISGTMIAVLSVGIVIGSGVVQATGSYAPGFEDTYRHGVMAYRDGHYNDALSALRKAEDLNPEHVNTQYYLAIVLDKLARGHEAAKYYALVSEFGTEARITDYARQRLTDLKIAMNLPQRNVRVAAPVSNPSNESTMAVAIPLMGQQNALMVNAKINNEVSGTFIVDTGATYTSISSDMARQLSDKLTTIGHVRITTANGQIEVPKVLIKEVTINGLVAHNVEATIIDLHKGGKFDGLLGLSFIRNFQLTIDPKANQLLFRAV